VGTVIVVVRTLNVRSTRSSAWIPAASRVDIAGNRKSIHRRARHYLARVVGEACSFPLLLSRISYRFFPIGNSYTRDELATTREGERERCLSLVYLTAGKRPCYRWLFNNPRKHTNPTAPERNTAERITMANQPFEGEEADEGEEGDPPLSFISSANISRRSSEVSPGISRCRPSVGEIQSGESRHESERDHRARKKNVNVSGERESGFRRFRSPEIRLRLENPLPRRGDSSRRNYSEITKFSPLVSPPRKTRSRLCKTRVIASRLFPPFFPTPSPSPSRA